jgi:polysaccharide biosynthesis/export protein
MKYISIAASLLVFLLVSHSFAQERPNAPQSPVSGPVPIPRPMNGTQGTEERYRIGFQDVLEIRVFRHEALTQRVNINPNGTINLFRLNEPILAVCKTERELADDIAKAYAKDYLRNPEVSVVAVVQQSQAFAVIGAVDKPGTYFISRPIRLLELLAQAGGPTKEAGSRLFVARTGSTSNCRMTVDELSEDYETLDLPLRDVLQAKVNLAMRPGDVVSVMEADVIYVYGNVEKQGPVLAREPMTLTQAIASAEGLKSATRRDNVRVLRQVPGSTERKEMVFDLNAIDRNQAPDPYLEPNDIVAVGEDRTKAILNSIGRSLTNGIPSFFYRVP